MGESHFVGTTLFTPPASPPFTVWVNPIHNKIWTEEEVLNVKRTHVEPKDLSDRVAYNAIRLIRKGFDIFR